MDVSKMSVGELKTSGIVIQVMAAIVFGFLGMQTGFVMAWPSYNVANFVSNDTVLEAPMSSLHISLLGGLPNLGGLLAMPVCGWVYSSIGRKYGTMLLTLPFVVAWLIISLTKQITLVLIAITIAGAGMAGQNISVVYISEIAHLSIRGAMSSCTMTGFQVGILVSYITGGYFEYSTVVRAHLAISVLTLLLFLLLPESPVFLLLVGKEKEAAKAISFYQRWNVKSKEVTAEIFKIKMTINPKMEKLLEEKDIEIEDRLTENDENYIEKEPLSEWQFLMKSKSSKRILVTMLIIIVTTILMGGSVLQVYAEPLLAGAVPSMSSNQCAIFMALDGLIATIVSVSTIDRLGRKTILMITSTVAGICTGLLGIQLQLHWAPPWFTVVLIYVYMFMFSAGCLMMPYVLASEVFLPEVRSMCNSICYAFVWIFIFINLFVFNPIVESIGLSYVFYIFCFMCFTGASYMYFYLLETKGLSVDTIQVRFLKRTGFRKKQ